MQSVHPRLAEALQDPRRERLVLRADVVDDVPVRVEVERRAARIDHLRHAPAADDGRGDGEPRRVRAGAANDRVPELPAPRARGRGTRRPRRWRSCAFAKVRSAGVLPARARMLLNTSLKALFPESTTAPLALPFARRWPSTVPGRSASSSGAAWLTGACVVVDASVVVGGLVLFPPQAASARTAASAPAAATRRARLPGPACFAFDPFDVASTCRSPERRAPAPRRSASRTR